MSEYTDQILKELRTKTEELSMLYAKIDPLLKDKESLIEKLAKVRERRDRWRDRAQEAERLLDHAADEGIVREAGGFATLWDVVRQRDDAKADVQRLRAQLAGQCSLVSCLQSEIDGQAKVLQRHAAELAEARADAELLTRERDAARRASEARADLVAILDDACRQLGNITYAELPGRIAAMRDALERRVMEVDKLRDHIERVRREMSDAVESGLFLTVAAIIESGPTV